MTWEAVLALVGEQEVSSIDKRLERMNVAITLTLGNFFVITGRRINRIRREIKVPGRSPVTADFEYAALGP